MLNHTKSLCHEKLAKDQDTLIEQSIFQSYIAQKYLNEVFLTKNKAKYSQLWHS